MNVDDRGQVIMLAALAVSVCLIALAMYLLSVENAETVENPRPGREALENVIWAQEIGLKRYRKYYRQLSMGPSAGPREQF